MGVAGAAEKRGKELATQLQRAEVAQKELQVRLPFSNAFSLPQRHGCIAEL